jgi:hypothetical protein
MTWRAAAEATISWWKDADVAGAGEATARDPTLYEIRTLLRDLFLLF